MIDRRPPPAGQADRPSAGWAERWKNRLVTRLVAPPSPVDVEGQQQRALLRLLRRSFGTELGRKYGVETVRSVADYQARVPVHRSEDMLPLWAREEQGERGVTVAEALEFFALSTGTTGAPKHIPVPRSLIRDNTRRDFQVLTTVLQQRPSSRLLSKQSFTVTGATRLGTLAGGAQLGTISGLMMATLPYVLRRNLLPDLATRNLESWEEKRRRTLEQVRGRAVGLFVAMPSVVVDTLRVMQQSWTADEYAAFVRGLEVIVFSGVNYRIYQHEIAQLLGRTDLTLVDFYSASEGILGYELSTEAGGLRLFHDSVFYELLDLEAYRRGDLGHRRTLSQAEAGARYALLVTTGNGGLSYVLGDVVECASTSPLRFRLAGRTKLSLNLVGEKVSVEEVESAVAALAQDLGSPGEFLVTRSSTAGRPGYLWIFEDTWAAVDRAKLASRLDESLRRQSHGYGFFREQLAPSEIVMVRRPEFQAWLAGRTKDPFQCKVPRIFETPEAVATLLQAARGEPAQPRPV